MKKRPVEFVFPVAGVLRRHAQQSQQPYSTPKALNIRPESVWEQRYRGGTRPGLTKAFSTQLGISSNRAVRMLTTIQHVSSNVLKTRVVASAGGNTHYELDDGTFSSSLPVGGLLDPTVTISGTQLVHAVDLLQKLYVADWDPDATISANDRAPKVFDPALGAGGLSKLTATDGTLPLGCPCIASFRGRIVLAGAYSDPHQWYMSRIGDPTDWDYAEGVDDPAAAVSGTLAPAFKVGEAITALIPTSDECLVFGCATSLWILRGDPLGGGHLDVISKEIGMVSHGAWCTTPEGAVVFLSHDGLYMLYGGCSVTGPQSLSRERIPVELLNVDRRTKIVNLAYDTYSRGVHIFLTPTDFSAATHWYFDWENKAFWQMSYPAAQQATAIHARRDFPASESVVLIGGSDGYVRWHRTSQTTDDGTAIASQLWYGPFGFGRGFRESCIDEIAGTPATSSGDIRYTIFGGSSPEEAYSHYDTGTIGIVDGVVTLTGGTFPAWAARGHLLVGNNIYKVSSRDSNTQLTLNDTTLDLSSGAAYFLTSASTVYIGSFLADRWNNREHPRVANSDTYVRLDDVSGSVWGIERVGLVVSERGRVRR
jgi:hypothetical protein